ncbi:unnamed protein product [Acidithrix sp. C25]|nr:unnamed protein product [Acidithrix sp. C25]
MEFNKATIGPLRIKVTLQQEIPASQSIQRPDRIPSQN